MHIADSGSCLHGAACKSLLHITDFLQFAWRAYGSITHKQQQEYGNSKPVAWVLLTNQVSALHMQTLLSPLLFLGHG